MQTTAYTHTPRPPITPADARYRYQRRFGPQEHGSHSLILKTEKEHLPKVCVYRDGETDLAELQVSIGNYSSAEITARLTPPELRELAARLLDAAHDIETLPAAVLTKAAA